MNLLKPKFWDKNKISFFAVLLLPITFLIKFLAFFKNLLTKKYKSSIPIICIGNIYLGGTGKTPTSITIYNVIKKLGYRPTFIKKFYRDQIDEQKLLNKNGNLICLKSRMESIKLAKLKKYNFHLQ